MGSLTVVLDTNVLVSAAGFGGPPLDAVFRAFDRDVQLLASEETLEELARVMDYEHLPFTDAEKAQYLTILRHGAEIVDPDHDLDVVRDADDNKFLEVALEGEADYVVSGDSDLLDLGSHGDIQILSPAEFLQQV